MAPILTILIALAVVVLVLRKLGENPDLSDMTLDDLVHYSYHAAMHGEYPNIYSEEYARRCNLR